MDHLSETQRDALRTALEGEREALLGRASQLVTQSKETTAAPDTGDRQDSAASEAARALEFRLARHELARLRELDAALQRMANGTYGICEESGDDIPFARLRLSPTARYTVEAQEELEREQAARARVHADTEEEDPY